MAEVEQHTSTGITVSFSCPGDAQFATREHANRVADDLQAEFGTIWTPVLHREHFHVADTGIATEHCGDQPGGERC